MQDSMPKVPKSNEKCHGGDSDARREIEAVKKKKDEKIQQMKCKVTKD